jgi:2-polyprenyl-3-methyl-5-hydroxy-6-metoxy-1,4-benzoquinol methylase
VNSLARYPEFAEYRVHYPIKESKYSSHYYLWRYAGRGNRILDVGCGEGFTAARLAELGNTVSGVDVLPQPQCRPAMENYWQCDLAAGMESVLAAARGERYDKILLMDILEHLPQPEKVLSQCAQLLAPNGQIVVSLPNVANVTMRWMLLTGRFEYADRGILDRTHLRFFTRRTARRLLVEQGYEILRETATVMPVELKLGIPASNPFMRALTAALAVPTRITPGLLGYQWIFVARPKRP